MKLASSVEIVLVGLNHRTAPVEVRERVSFTTEQAKRAAEELRTRGILEETLVLSTCNRSEIYGVPPESSRESAPGLSSFLSEFHSVRPDILHSSLYHRYDRDAVGHLFRVSAGLDSQLLGETEILGQVREAYRVAHELGATGPVLNRLFQGALEVGKRVRAETELGTRPMSVAAAGIKLAERIFGKLRDRTAVVLGAGQVGEQVISQLRDRSIKHLLVMNRSSERAAGLARQYGGEVIPWGNWETALEHVDVLVASVGAEERVLTCTELERIMVTRGNRALLVMDLGVPRNIDPEARNLYNLYLYNMENLSDIVEQNRGARESEVPHAESIVNQHVEKFLSWQASVELVSLVEALRSRVREQRAAFFRERADGFHGFDAETRSRLESMMDDLLENVLVQPAQRLRGEKELRRKIQSLEAIRELFLDSGEKH